MIIFNRLLQRIHFLIPLIYFFGCSRDLSVPSPVPSKDPSEQWETLLNQISTEDGILWETLEQNQQILENYIAWTGVTGPQSNRKSRTPFPRRGRTNHRLTHFVNAYNAWLLYAYLHDGKQPIDSLKYDYSRDTRIFVDGEYSSFSHIKHERLLADFQEPSIHMMLYDLKQQSTPLQFWQSKSWRKNVNNTWAQFMKDHGAQRTDNGWVFHPIFKHYEMDFIDWSNHDTVCSYLIEYTGGELQQWLQQQSSSCIIEYFEINDVN